eukprot:c31387_g1_i1.p1 GENE.c31387_g1_i1~~c31387_g1_i1.p1  ORF type:complete len:127 (-),score=13.29 c31387_g1_i1:100-480(-)
MQQQQTLRDIPRDGMQFQKYDNLPDAKKTMVDKIVYSTVFWYDHPLTRRLHGTNIQNAPTALLSKIADTLAIRIDELKPETRLSLLFQNYNITCRVDNAGWFLDLNLNENALNRAIADWAKDMPVC